MATTSLILNHTFLKNRLAELEIKQWWLAEQVGVDRKTVTRWIQGQVRSIQLDNVEKLAQILHCGVDQLTLKSELDQLATAEDQKTAAKLLLESSIFKKLGPIDEWNVIEALVKATIVPNLPLNILGELYNRLSLVLWRQKKFSQAELANLKAQEIANQLNDQTLLASSLLGKANLLAWKGLAAQALLAYKECLALSTYLNAELKSSAWSNKGAMAFESGDVDLALICQNKALDLLNSDDARPTLLSVVHMHLAMIALVQKKLASAEFHSKQSCLEAQRDHYHRGLAMGKLIEAELLATRGNQMDSWANLQEGMKAFSTLEFQEGVHFEFAGRTARLLGRNTESEQYLEQGMVVAQEFPIYQAALAFEFAQTLHAQKSTRTKELALTSISLYQQCEAPLKEAEVRRWLNSL